MVLAVWAFVIDFVGAVVMIVVVVVMILFGSLVG